MAFTTGNVGQMKVPCVVNSQGIMGVEAGTKEGDVVATLAVGVSTLVSTIMVALAMVFVTIIYPVLSQMCIRDRDRECDLKDNREIRLAASRLAMLHKSLRRVPFQEEWNMGSILIEPLETELERHNRELQRARNYIRGKRKKSEFELCVIGNYNMFYEQAVQAVEGLKGLWEETRAASLDGEDSKPLYLCHGDLDPVSYTHLHIIN